MSEYVDSQPFASSFLLLHLSPYQKQSIRVYWVYVTGRESKPFCSWICFFYYFSTLNKREKKKQWSWAKYPQTTKMFLQKLIDFQLLSSDSWCYRERNGDYYPEIGFSLKHCIFSFSFFPFTECLWVTVCIYCNTNFCYTVSKHFLELIT